MNLLEEIKELLDKEESYWPSYEHVYRCFNFRNPEEIRVVIVGQDPYPKKELADGLAFSCPNGSKTPKSLQRIKTLLTKDLGISKKSNSLEGWAIQGVLLLNSILTYGHKNPRLNSLWQNYVDTVITNLNDYGGKIIWCLWGKAAQSKKRLITNPRQFIIEAPHPSCRRAKDLTEFLNQKAFSKINKYLDENGFKPIDWSL